MEFRSFFRRYSVPVGFVSLFAMLSGCQSGNGVGFLNLGLGSSKEEPGEERVEQVNLNAYCPNVRLREGTAYYNTYQKASRGESEQDPDKLIYQASITAVTRGCDYSGGQLVMNIAVAGKVVPGPAAKPGTINLPIRVAVLRGEDILYSELHAYPVQIGSGTGATQFVFSDPNVVIPVPTARNILVLAGYDEGPAAKP